MAVITPLQLRGCLDEAPKITTSQCRCTCPRMVGGRVHMTLIAASQSQLADCGQQVKGRKSAGSCLSSACNNRDLTQTRKPSVTCAWLGRLPWTGQILGKPSGLARPPDACKQACSQSSKWLRMLYHSEQKALTGAMIMIQNAARHRPSSCQQNLGKGMEYLIPEDATGSPNPSRDGFSNCRALPLILQCCCLTSLCHMV